MQWMADLRVVADEAVAQLGGGVDDLLAQRLGGEDALHASTSRADARGRARAEHDRRETAAS